jgi:D-aminoacyl-tRNA deacylase
VSQFTLLAKTKKGTKPDFHGAMNPEEASRLYHYFVSKVQEGFEADRVKDGKFQAMMEVALVNDGPVSLPSSLPMLVCVTIDKGSSSNHLFPRPSCM